MVTPNRPPPADVAASTKLLVLTQKECWALVKQAALGRLAFVMDDWPLVMPVNYLVDGDDVVIRSDHGRKLTAARQQVQATLQVDSIDRVHRSGWSVLVFGVATAVDDSVVLILPTAAWPRLVERFPALTANMLQTIGTRLQESHTRILEMSTQQV